MMITEISETLDLCVKKLCDPSCSSSLRGEMAKQEIILNHR